MNRAQRPVSRLYLSAVSLAAVLTLLFAAPANAQDEAPADADPIDELPTGPPTDETAPETNGGLVLDFGDAAEPETPAAEGEGGLGLDFGDAVNVDDEGNVIWNVETDTTEADEVVVEPTPIPDSGIEGSGELQDPEVPLEETDTTGVLSGSSSGKGNSTMLLFAVVGGALALIAVGAYVGQRRAAARREAELLDPIDPVMDEGVFPPAAGDAAPAYAGAEEAGAYEAGGAAYAQYTEPEYSAAAAGVTGLDEGPRTKLDQLRMSVVDAADKGLADAGHDRLVAKKLEAAGSQMRPGEWLVLGGASTVAAFFGVTFMFGWLLGIAAAVACAYGFWSMLSFKEGRRQRLFADQLPETLGLLAGSLRGGLSMMQSIQTVADEADEPTAGEFQRVVTETRLGRDLALAFRDLTDRMDSKDFEWVVTAIEIHREVGGDLAAILDRVANTIRARNRVRGQVQALSAEGKMSGLILFFLPPGMVMAIAALNRDYLNEMVDTTEGQIMLIVSGVLLLIGGAWLKRLSRFVY